MSQVVFCPHPPLLAAGELVGHVEEVVPTRAAAHDAVRDLVASAPQRVLVLGDQPPSGPTDASAGGTLLAHGLDVTAGGPGDTSLGLAHAVGAWLLDRAGWDGPRSYVCDLTPDDLTGDMAVLVMADGAATRTERAPGHLDARAEPFDAAVVSALRDGDADALGGIDLDVARDLWCHGAPTWRRVGDAVAARVHGHGVTVTPRLVLAEAPLGVGWFVAVWQLG